MILSFKEQFKDKILKGQKIHTIREDKHNRWKAGMKIHFWKGNPRNVGKNPYQFAENTVTRTAKIEINWIRDTEGDFEVDGKMAKSHRFEVKVNDQILDDDTLRDLAISDGFDDIEGFARWFKKGFKGKLIYWYFGALKEV